MNNELFLPSYTPEKEDQQISMNSMLNLNY